MDLLITIYFARDNVKHYNILVALIVKKIYTIMSQLFLFFSKTQRAKTYPEWLPHAEKPEKKKPASR